jgi:hypothetical protein
MSSWFNHDTDSTDYSLSIPTGSSNDHRFGIGRQSGGAGFAVARTATTRQGVTNNTVTSGVWAHVCGVFASNSSRTAILNGDLANKDTEPTSNTPDATMNMVIVGARQDGTSGSWDGDVAETAIWDVALSDDEVVALSLGYSPQLIRPASLVFYCPVFRQIATDLVTGASLDIVGTPTDERHTRMIYPATFVLGVPAAAVAAITPAEIVAASTSLDNSPDHPDPIFVPF